jgi:transcriptional regulator with XRE-family HTH domain
MSIHSRIKERRLALGMTSHKALADRVGVSWQTVQLWEKEGGTAPNRSRVEKVASTLGVTVSWLINGDEELALAERTDDSRVIQFGEDTTPRGKTRAGLETNLLVHTSADSPLAAQAEHSKNVPRVEYIFATPEEIRLLTLFRTSDERERSELMDRLALLKKVVKLPTLVGGD